MTTLTTHSDDDRSNISGRSSIRQNEIQLIKQIPLIHLLESRGFRPSRQNRKLSSAVFPNLPNIDGEVSVFYGRDSKVWLCKFVEPRPHTRGYNKLVTRSILDLWQVLYWPDLHETESYPRAVAELREIAGIGRGSGSRTGKTEPEKETGDGKKYIYAPNPPERLGETTPADDMDDTCNRNCGSCELDPCVLTGQPTSF